MKAKPSFEFEPYLVAQRLRIRATCTDCDARFVGDHDTIEQWRSEHFCASADGQNPYCCFQNSLWIPTLLADSIDASRADFGNIQLFDSCRRVLRIQVSRGFGREFLDYFDTVSERDCACGAAVEARTRVVVSDVSTEPVFGEQSRAILLRSNVRSVVSTPLLDRSRNLIGMLSVHSPRPQHFFGARLKNIDDLIAGFAF